MQRWAFKTICRPPTGGHHFPVSQGFTLRADDPGALASKLKQHRTANGLSPGDPAQEIARYYAEHFPWAVEPDGDQEAPECSTWNICAYVREEWRLRAYRLALDPEIKARREVCLGCPHNQPIPWKSDPEHKEARRRLFMLRRGQPVPDALGYCTAHLWDNGLATMKADPGATQVVSGCWHRK